MTVDIVLCDRFVRFLADFAKGEAHAMTASTLIAALDLPDTPGSRRHLRACAQHASKAGHLVCSGNSGYFVPASRLEADSALKRLRSEGFALLERARRGDVLASKRFGLLSTTGNRAFVIRESRTDRGLLALLEAE